jgi:hypothetical protein
MQPRAAAVVEVRNDTDSRLIHTCFVVFDPIDFEHLTFL